MDKAKNATKETCSEFQEGDYAWLNTEHKHILCS